MAHLSPQQLHQLIPLIPTILAWLRHIDPKTAGDLFLAPTHSDEVQNTLRELINSLNFNGGELTNVQYRYIFFCRDKSIWASCVRSILLESEPRICSSEIGAALIACLPTVHAASDSDEACKVLGAQLDQLPRTNFLALGELCAFLRDTCSESSQMACMLGPMLFAPRIAGGSAAATAASAIMDVLIDEAESVFGRSAGYAKKDAMGVRKPPPVIPNRNRAAVENPSPAPPRGFSESMSDPDPPSSSWQQQPGNSSRNNAPQGSLEQMKQSKDAKRRDQLRAFFEFQNTKMKLSEVVDDIFDNHDFEDIAQGIYFRYNLLPAGWQHDLIEVRNQGSNKLQWFDEHKINMQKAMNQQGRPISLVPPPAASPPAPAGKLSQVDQIINEIIDTEEKYRDNLDELHQLYIVVVRDIALGKKGKEAAEELGLTSPDVERIFGWRIQEIVKVSANLQKRLEVVNLCRSEVKSDLERRGKVAEAFLAVGGDLHVYAPYVSAHRTSLQTLEAATKIVNQKQEQLNKKQGGLFKKSDNKEIMSFVKLWEVISNSSSRLRGQSLSSLLIMPIQRVPRYKLLINELLKATPAEHPAHVPLVDALELVNQQAKQINEALRQHEKLEKFFGQEDMIGPSMSEVEKNGKIKQGYVDA